MYPSLCTSAPANLLRYTLTGESPPEPTPSAVRTPRAKIHLGNVKSCHSFGERVALNEQVQQITASHVLENEVQMIRVLEGVKQLDDPAWRSPSRC